MADLLLVRAEADAKEAGKLRWEFVEETLRSHQVLITNLPEDEPITVGDIWHVEYVGIRPGAKLPKVVSVSLIAKIKTPKNWETLESLPDHWMDPYTLEEILLLIHRGEDIILMGDPGTGKTMFCGRLARHLNWQEACKVDLAHIKHPVELFGSDAASGGSTKFVRSKLREYILRAHAAWRDGVDTHFLVILDELNRAAGKITAALLGLFDDTRQLSMTTSDGTEVIQLPPNLHTIATMNEGVQHETFPLPPALKDRFHLARVEPMPEPVEVMMLMSDPEISISETTAQDIVRVARALREAYHNRALGAAPSFRHVRRVAKLLDRRNARRIDPKRAFAKVFLPLYAGEFKVNHRTGDITVAPNTDAAKAYAALVMKNRDNGGKKGHLKDAALAT